jgi:hypothetical protein
MAGTREHYFLASDIFLRFIKLDDTCSGKKYINNGISFDFHRIIEQYSSFLFLKIIQSTRVFIYTKELAFLNKAFVR